MGTVCSWDSDRARGERATANLKAALGTEGPGEADATVQLEKTPPAVGQTCRPVGWLLSPMS